MDFVKAPEATFVDTDEAVVSLLQKCMNCKVVGLDLETISHKIPYWEDVALYMGVAVDEVSRYLVPRQYIHYFKPLLESDTIIKAFHNAKFDTHRLLTMGIRVCSPLADTIVMSHLDYEERRHGLKELVPSLLDIPMMSYKDIMGKHDPRSVEPGHEIWESFLDYSSLDPYVTLKLFHYFKQRLSSKKIWPGTQDERTLYDLYWEYEEPQLLILFDMEIRGIRVDVDHLENVRKTLQEEMLDLATNICKLAKKPINPNSPQQIAELMFGDHAEGNFGLTPIDYTPSGKYKCDEKVLKKLVKGLSEDEEAMKHQTFQDAVEIAKRVIQFKKASKLKGTYAEGLAKRLDKNNYIHTNYMPMTKAGRLSSSNPNLQNIPSARKDPHDIRGAFIADDDDHILIGADYSQLEWRVMAHASLDESLIDTFIRGLDQHSVTGALMLGISYEEFYNRYKAGDAECKIIRSAGKAVSFGYLYGGTAWTVSDSLTEALGRVVTKEEAQKFIDMYKDGYPGVVRQVEAFKNTAKSKKENKTIIGRIVHFPDIDSRNWSSKNHALNQAINCPIQGSAADIVKKAMISCFNSPKLQAMNCTIRLQIHDELIFNVPKEHAEECSIIIKDLMENPFNQPLAVPLIAEPAIELNWGLLK